MIEEETKKKNIDAVKEGMKEGINKKKRRE